MKLLLFSLISLYFLIGFIPNKADANDFDLTIITSDGGDLDILQDGEDNNIDLDVQSMDNFELDFSQLNLPLAFFHLEYEKRVWQRFDNV